MATSADLKTVLWWWVGLHFVSAEGVDQGARHTALWRTLAEVEGRRCVRSHSDPLTGGGRKLLIHTQVGRGGPGTASLSISP